MRHEDISTLGYGCKSKAETVRGANAKVVEMPEEESMTDQIGRIDSLQILVVNYFEPYQLRYRSEASTLRPSTELRIHTTNLRYAFIDGRRGLAALYVVLFHAIQVSKYNSRSPPFWYYFFVQGR